MVSLYVGFGKKVWILFKFGFRNKSKLLDMFRRTRSMHLYRAGMPLALLSEWLGHENPETSLIYAYADTEMKREAIRKATRNNNPLNVNKIQAFWKNDDELIRQLYGLK
jgi:hypothetical protein